MVKCTIMSMIKVTTSDDKEFPVDRSIVDNSELLKNILEDLDDNDAIPVDIESGIFAKVIAYMDQQNKDEKWNTKFCESMTETELFSLILAAEHLGFKSLSNMLCTHVGRSIKGLSAEEICKKFGLPDDMFTEEEKENIRKENEWKE